MTRPRKKVGELGQVTITELGSGRFRARGSVRDAAGSMHKIDRIGETAEQARKLVELQARRIWGGYFHPVFETTTLDDVAQQWMEALPRKVAAEKIIQQTAEKYAADWRSLSRRIGTATVAELGPGFIDTLLEELAATASSAAARRARNIW